MRKVISIIGGLLVGATMSLALFSLAARNSSGTYSLPASVNPVTSGTSITTTWANTTLNDLAAEMTNSLDRGGRGSMSAQLKLFDGASNLPGLGFSAEPGSGLYRAGATDLGLVVNQVRKQQWTPTLTTITTDLTSSGNLTVNGIGLSNFAGNLSVTGTLGVTGITTHTDLVTFNNGATVASGNLLLSQGVGQSISKSGADLTVGTSDANELCLMTGGVCRETISSAGVAAFTSKPTAPSTVGGDGATTLATKDYIDAADALKAPLASPTFTGTVTVPALTGAEASTTAVNKGYVDAAASYIVLGSDQNIGTSLTTVFTIPTYSTACTVEVLALFSFGSCTPSMTFRANTSAGDAGNAWYSSKLICGSSGSETLATTADVQGIDGTVWGPVTGVAASTNCTWHFFGVVRNSASGTLTLLFQNSAASTTVKQGSRVSYYCY